MIIIHIGTNDLTKKVDTIPNLQSIINRIKKKSAATKLVISSILQRRDHPDVEEKVIARNKDIGKLRDENLIRYLNNNNINESCLAKGKLHPNKKGNSYLANNFMRIIEDIDWRISASIIGQAVYEQRYVFNPSENGGFFVKMRN